MKTLLPFLIALLACVHVYAQQSPQKGLKLINTKTLKEYIDYLASDKMQGRSSPSKELDLSADYIAGKFKEYGVKAPQQGYYQTIPFCAGDLDVDKCVFRVTKGTDDKGFALKTEYTPLFNTANGVANGEIVFAGYGITAPEYNYDDYQGIDVKGKLVLVMRFEPRETDSTSIFEGKRDTRYSNPEYKIKNAIEHGAAGLLLVTGPLHHMAITAQGYAWHNIYLKNKPFKPSYEICADGEKIPVVQVSEKVIDYLMGDLDTLKAVQKQIDDNMQPRSYVLQGIKAELSTSLVSYNASVKNVVGFMEGSDPVLKNEYVIIGAHYDHIGVRKAKNQETDSVYNGADDNASGTAGVLNLAKAFSVVKQKPKRSIVFVLFAAEELGLVGSDYYCEHPVFPIDKTVAMLNMDMIGRNGTDSVQYEGEDRNPDLVEIVKKQVAPAKLTYVPPTEDLFARSDQYNFYRKGVSAMGFTSGLHNDYHTVRDNPEAINFIKAQKITQLVYRVAWVLVNDNKYYKINKK